MADRRRRRRPQTSESEHSESEENVLRKPKQEGRIRESECESELDDKDGSDYESVSEDVEEDDFTYTEDYSEDGESVIIETDSYYEDESSMFGERESGDGEEQPDRQSELDADEDKKNPAYVPKRGNFYEHDSREGEEGEEGEKQQQDARREAKKKLWMESNKWAHDKFDLSQQGPKPRDELMRLYGYDVRAHSEPPESVPFLNQGQRRERRRDDRNQLGDFMNDRDQDSRPRGGYRGGRGGSRGRGSRGRGRGVPNRSGPRTPPGPPPGRWVDDPRRTYSDYRDRGERYRQNSGSESFARDTSPNDPAQRRRMQNNARNEHEQRQGYSNEHEQNRRRADYDNEQERQQNREYRNDNRPGPNRGNRSEPPQRQQQQYQRREDPNAGGDNQQNRRPGQGPKSQDARFDSNDFRSKRSYNKAKEFAEDTEEKGLENLMEIAPPLTTIETRTTVSTVRADEGPQRRGGYVQDKRTKKTPPRPREDGDKLGKREMTEKPPRFREQEKAAVQQPRDQRVTKRYSTQRQRVAESGAVESPPPNVNVMVPPPGLQMVAPRAMHPAGDGHQANLVGHQPNVSSPRIVSTQAPGRIAQPAYYGPAPQGVYRQPPPIYRAVTQPGVVTQQRPMLQPVTSQRPVLSQQHVLVQQQAMAMQGKVQATAAMGQMSQTAMYTSSQQHRPIMTTARPPPPLVATRPPGAPAGQLIAAPAPPGAQPPPQATAQFIAAPLVNIAAAGPPPQAYQLPPGQVPAQVAFSANQVPQGAEGVSASGTPVSPSAQFIAVPQAPLPAHQAGSSGTAAPGPGQPPAIHVRGGTTYFHPQIQPLADGRSPARRAKEPIPIVNPQQPGDVQYYIDPAYDIQGDAQGYVQYVQQGEYTEGVVDAQYSEYTEAGYVQEMEGISQDQQNTDQNITYEQRTEQSPGDTVETACKAETYALNPEVEEFVQASGENEESDESTAKLSDGHISDDDQNIEELEENIVPSNTGHEEQNNEVEEIQSEQLEQVSDSAIPGVVDSKSTPGSVQLSDQNVLDKHESNVEDDSDSEQFFEAETLEGDTTEVHQHSNELIHKEPIQTGESNHEESLQSTSESKDVCSAKEHQTTSSTGDILIEHTESNETPEQSSMEQKSPDGQSSVVSRADDLAVESNENADALEERAVTSDTENNGVVEVTEPEALVDEGCTPKTEDLADKSDGVTENSNDLKDKSDDVSDKSDDLGDDLKDRPGDLVDRSVNETLPLDIAKLSIEQTDRQKTELTESASNDTIEEDKIDDKQLDQKENVGGTEV